MNRSTKSQKVERVNAAYALLAQGYSVSEAAQRLSQRFGLSRAQSHRYVRSASTMDGPVETAEASIPMTIKVPVTVAARLRAHAKGTGHTIGQIVARAVGQLLAEENRDG